MPDRSVSLIINRTHIRAKNAQGASRRARGFRAKTRRADHLGGSSFALERDSQSALYLSINLQSTRSKFTQRRENSPFSTCSITAALSFAQCTRLGTYVGRYVREALPRRQGRRGSANACFMHDRRVKCGQTRSWEDEPAAGKVLEAEEGRRKGRGARRERRTGGRGNRWRLFRSDRRAGMCSSSPTLARTRARAPEYASDRTLPGARKQGRKGLSVADARARLRSLPVFL